MDILVLIAYLLLVIFAVLWVNRAAKYYSQGEIDKAIYAMLWVLFIAIVLK